MFAPEDEPEKSRDELEDDIQCCLLPNIRIELFHNRYPESLHKPLELNKFEFMHRTAIDRRDDRAADELLPLIYEELRLLAAQKLSHERHDQTLQVTALVHEAYIRLVGHEGHN